MSIVKVLFDTDSDLRELLSLIFCFIYLSCTYAYSSLCTRGFSSICKQDVKITISYPYIDHKGSNSLFIASYQFVSFFYREFIFYNIVLTYLVDHALLFFLSLQSLVLFTMQHSLCSVYVKHILFIYLIM